MRLWNDLKQPKAGVGCGGVGPWCVGFYGTYGDLGWVEVQETTTGLEFVITPANPQTKVKMFEDENGVVRVRYPK